MEHIVNANLKSSFKQSPSDDCDDGEVRFVTSKEAECDVALGSAVQNRDVVEKVSVHVCSPSDHVLWSQQDGYAKVMKIPSQVIDKTQPAVVPSLDRRANDMPNVEVYSYTSVDTLVRNKWAYEPRKQSESHKDTNIT